jgi:hypothetical protein
MGDPFQTYNEDVDRFLGRPRPSGSVSDDIQL